MISGLKITELPSGRELTWPADEIPPEHIWAYDHLIDQNCGSISVGKTVYSIVNDYRFPTAKEKKP